MHKLCLTTVICFHCRVVKPTPKPKTAHKAREPVVSNMCPLSFQVVTAFLAWEPAHNYGGVWDAIHQCGSAYDTYSNVQFRSADVSRTVDKASRGNKSEYIIYIKLCLIHAAEVHEEG